MTGRVLQRPSMSAIALALIEAELLLGPLHWLPLQAAVALPLVLLLPGWALERALFDRGGLADRVVTAMGLSLAVLAVGGIVLNFFPVGMHPVTWLLYLTAVAVVGDIAGWLRNQSKSLLTESRLRWPKPQHVAASIALLVILAGAFGVSIVAADRQNFPPFTQLWLVPGSRGTGYQLGVQTHMAHSGSYQVKLKVNGRVVRKWGPLLLSSHAEWNVRVGLPRHAAVRALLFRSGTQHPYRVVFIRDS
jgi:uncharacterized membrane protein